MKKLFLLIAAACVSLTAVADEGMWMLPYLQKMNTVSYTHLTLPTKA